MGEGGEVEEGGESYCMWSVYKGGCKSDTMSRLLSVATVVTKDVCGRFDSDKKENVRALVKEMDSADGDNWWEKIWL